MEVDVPRELVLAGPFGQDDAATLSASCRRLGRDGVAEVVVDVGAVTHCDADGLACWLDLARGSGGTTVTVRGARWSQFLELLRRTPVTGLAGVCEQVRGLVPSTHPTHPTAAAGGTS